VGSLTLELLLTEAGIGGGTGAGTLGILGMLGMGGTFDKGVGFEAEVEPGPPAVNAVYSEPFAPVSEPGGLASAGVLGMPNAWPGVALDCPTPAGFMPPAKVPALVIMCVLMLEG